MKIIHCADIHLGSKLASKFPGNISDERKREVLDTFSRMVDYAKKNQVKVIMLSGDVFDKDKPAKKAALPALLFCIGCLFHWRARHVTRSSIQVMAAPQTNPPAWAIILI